MIAQSVFLPVCPTRPTRPMPLDPALPIALLAGLSPRAFMRRHWQKKPLLVRQAVPGGIDWTPRSRLFALAADDTTESRLVTRDAHGWRLRPGPIRRAALPPLKQPGWTLLVQGVDLRWPEARALLDRFRFLPDVRLDDLMISYASDGGGVGPHLDSYDVFLLQAAGRRRWRVGRVARPVRLMPDVPLKLLADFVPAHDWLLEPGDMLYLPPGWGHDGVAEGSDCITCSIGLRAPDRAALAREVLQRVLDADGDASAEVAEARPRLYTDPRQDAVDRPGRLPETLRAFAATAVARLANDRDGLALALGEVLSDPKPGTTFDRADVAHAAAPLPADAGIALDRRSRLLYDDRHVFFNGEAFRAGGRDATLLRRLADHRRLAAPELRRLSAEARAQIDVWHAAGWLHAQESIEGA